MFNRLVTSVNKENILSPHEESNLRPSDLRSDALPLSHRDSTVSEVYYEVHMTRVPVSFTRSHVNAETFISVKRRSMRERMKEHDRDIRFARTQTSAVLEHANETGHIPMWRKVKFIDRDPHWCTRKIKAAIHRRLHPNNINRDSGIEIPEAWIPTIKQPNSRSVRTYQRTPSNDRNNNEDRNALIAANQRATNSNT